MLNVLTKYFKPSVPVLPGSYLVTSAGVRMRKPYDKDGKWIGWTAEETAAHLASINSLSSNKKADNFIVVHTRRFFNSFHKF